MALSADCGQVLVAIAQVRIVLDVSLELLGHANIKMVERYAHLTLKS